MKSRDYFVFAVLLTLVFTCMLAMPLNAYANSGGKTIPNGKPFQELNRLITENRNLIEANEQNIAGLNFDAAAINARIDTVESDLKAVADQVALNAADITAAFARIASAEGDIGALRTDLGALAEQHQTDISLLKTTLDNVQLQINDLVAQGTALATELNDRVTELRGLIDNNGAVAIDALLLDISMLNAQVGTINANILALSNQQANLSEQIAEHAAQLASLSAALDELKLRGDDDYYAPCLASIALGDVVTGELVNDGQCTSDSRSGRAARYYTFTIDSTAEVTIAMDGSVCSNSWTLSDPYLYLHAGGRSGNVIAQNDDVGGGCRYNSRITQTLDPGMYTIEATSFSSIYGTFQISVQ